ncbi:MAG: hypothetical protein AMJ62_12065 [Myxococcales bacterium SG8_38]|nr:MAG: hypothetical protein AMJ62_12065 [Myxococcales bacterium SG8_38]
MMRLAITQPNFLPWLGYFELLDYVDVWVSLDNVQLSRGSFVLRNRVRRPDGEVEWISVSIPKKCRLGTSIKDAPVSNNGWQDRIIRRLESYYRSSPFYGQFGDRVAALLAATKDLDRVAALNEFIIHEVSSWLGIEYDFYRASDLIETLEGSPQEKVLSLIQKFDADTYCNFAGGIDAGLYDPSAFERVGVSLEKHGYRHPTYPQHGGGFMPYLSIVDLLFETGPGSLEVLRRGRRWERMHPDFISTGG